MAGTNKYQRAKKMLKELVKKYSKVSTHTLRAQIMIHLGGDERTILSYLTVMKETGLIKDTQTGWLLCPTENK